jgi:predicted protein tyrosine phosphatase
MPLALRRGLRRIGGMAVLISAPGTRLSICGLDEIAALRDRSVTHVLSILDPAWPDPAAFAEWRPHVRHTLRFHDIIAEYPGFDAPTHKHVESVIAFGEAIEAVGEPVGHLLIHCHAGISRSTASMAILLARETPGQEAAVFERLRAVRPQAWPNSRMIRLADDILGCGGRLIAELREHYLRQVDRRPELTEMIRSLGRDAEIPG